jgi:hypothetical protein
MDIDAFNDTVRRRAWLLAKALETAPLAKALELARAADEFLGGEAHPAPSIEPGPESPPADPAPVLGEPAVEPEVAAAQKTDTARGTISVDDVVRYLRQRDDTVVRTEKDLFMVNGRFQMNADQLVARANRMRAQDGNAPLEPSPRPEIGLVVATAH